MSRSLVSPDRESLAQEPSIQESLRHAIEARLRAAGYRAMPAISIHFTGSEIVLEGRVTTYYLKQVIQAAALAAGAAIPLKNDIVVAPRSPRGITG
jgi:hypothetical protein